MATTPCCDSCGDPATYIWQVRADHQERLCSECARFRGARERGEADAALETLGFAVGMARNRGVTDDQLREAFETILTAPASIGRYRIGGDGVLGRDSRDAVPWQWAGSWARLIGAGV
jgi:hypothetical protein